jgi:spermidine/putrescine transport system permease protein
MKETKTQITVRILFITLVLLVIYLPILSIIIFSFNSGRSATKWEGFTFNNYVKLFSNRAILKSIWVTFFIAGVATVISVVIGTFAAISLASMSKPKLRSAIFSMNDLPILNPDIVTAISLFLLFGSFKIPAGYVSLILSHIAFCVPYVLITTYPKVITLDPNVYEAARDLGASNTQTLFKIIIPQILGAILAGAAIAFTMSFDDFVISYFAVGDSGLQNISIYLYSLRRGVDPTINALTSLIILGIALVLTINYLLTRKKKVID